MAGSESERRSFLEEFSSLPNKSPEHTEYFWPQSKDVNDPPCHFVPVLAGEQLNVDHLRLFIGKAPASLNDQVTFWRAVMRENVCSIVTVTCETSAYAPFGANGVQGAQSEVVTVTDHVDAASYRYGQVAVKDSMDGKEFSDCYNWIFKGWPSATSPIVVPAIPHFFLDFIRSILARSYLARKAYDRPILILFNDTPDIAALTACIMLVVHQSCERRSTFVYRCVADLRRQFQCNVISRFAMYHFIYECILMTTCATPTIMVHKREDFKTRYYNLFHRPRENDGGRLPQPIVEQFRLIKQFVDMYRPKPRGLLTRLLTAEGAQLRKNMYQPRHYAGVTFWKLFSFEFTDHFLSIRRPVDNIETLFDIMAKYNSRTLFWFSETASSSDEILAGVSRNNRRQVALRNTLSHDGFHTFEMEAPTEGQGLFQVTCFQFYGWPANLVKPKRSCREFLAPLRAAMEHARSFGSGKVVVYESPQGGSVIWRGAMLAIGAYLDQRMRQMEEVDVFRTVQMYKIYDRDTIVTSIDQYKWCFQMAWSSLQYWESSGN